MVLGLILAVQATASFGPIGLPALAPLLRADLGLSRTEAGSLLSAYYVGSLLVAVPAGYVADRLGVRWTLAAGQLAIAAGLLALSTVRTPLLALAAVVAAGLGFGVLNPTSTKAVIAWFPLESRATAVGVKQTGLPLGGALGAKLLPVLALGLALGWRGAVRAAAVAVASMALVSALGYRDRAEPAADAAGPPAGRASPWRVLRDGDLWLVSAVTVLFAGVQTTWTGYLVLFLEERVGMDVVAGGVLLALANVAGIAGRIGFGVLSDRLLGGRRRIVLVLAGAGSGLLSAGMVLVGPGTPWPALAALALAFGVVGIGWNGVQLTLLAELAGRELAGTAVGLGLAVSALGVILGPPAFGWLVEGTGGAYERGWLALAGTMGIAMLLLARVREPARDW